MNTMRTIVGLGVAAALYAVPPVFAQTPTGLPASQPNLLLIYREEVKVGRNAEHERTEMGWPAAYEKAKSPYYYLALVSLTGAPEAWFVSPFESYEQMDKAMAIDRDDPMLALEIPRLQRADGEHLNGIRSYHAVARKELSHGQYPDISKQRYFTINTFRMRPGREADFAAAAKAYGGALARAGSPATFRVYQIAAGMPSPTYIVFGSTPTLGALDTLMAAEDAVSKAFRPEDQKIFEKFFEGLASSDSQRFAVNPAMSYVSAEVRASDPSFWMPKKKPTPKKITTTESTPKTSRQQ